MDDNYDKNFFFISTIFDDEDNRISLENSCYNYMKFDSKNSRLYLIGISMFSFSYFSHIQIFVQDPPL